VIVGNTTIKQTVNTMTFLIRFTLNGDAGSREEEEEKKEEEEEVEKEEEEETKLLFTFPATYCCSSSQWGSAQPAVLCSTSPGWPHIVGHLPLFPVYKAAAGQGVWV